jgi:hypothetical protein
VLRTTRIGTDASQIRLSSATYGTDGNLLTETNALEGVTIYSRGTNASGQTVLTNTAPDGGVRQMQQLAKTLTLHARGILNWWTHRISNGRMEGINNKIKTLLT